MWDDVLNPLLEAVTDSIVINWTMSMVLIFIAAVSSTLTVETAGQRLYIEARSPTEHDNYIQ